MKKSKKALAVVLAIVIALSTIAVSGSVFTASALAKPEFHKVEYTTKGTVELWCYSDDEYRTYDRPNEFYFEIARLKKGEKNYSYFYRAYNDSSFYNDNTVSAGNIYYYQLRTYVLKNGKKTYSPWSKVYTLTTLFPPTIKSMFNRTTYLNINWNKILGAKQYRLAFKREGDKLWNYRIVTKNYYNVPNPTKGAVYFAQVQAINGNVYGPWSRPGAENIDPVPKPIFTSNHSYDDEFVDVYWSYNAPNPDHFILYYKRAGEANWSNDWVDGKFRDHAKEYHKGTGLVYFQLAACDKNGNRICPFSKVYSFKR